MRKTPFLVLVLALMLMLFSSASQATLLGTYQGHTYEVYHAPGINPSSVFGSYPLAVITSQNEQDWVRQQMIFNALSGEYWIGGFQPAGETNPIANWQWVNGEPWSFAPWWTNTYIEPNDFYGPGSEQYLAIWDNYDWSWNDEGCLPHIQGYVTEKPIPEPATLMLFGLGLISVAGYSRHRFKKTSC